MASLWTGLYPARTGVTRFDHVIAEEATLPAEIFRQAGYQTAGLYRNGWVSPNFGFSQGFDVYHKPRPRPLLPSEKRQNPTLSVEGTDVSAIETAVSFLRTNGSQRFFLYVHLMDVHEYVYDDSSADFGDTYSDIYDKAILRLNHVLDGLIREVWSDRELASRTLIVISSDHGEGFGERGLEGHARNVYPEVTEVPFLIALPFRLEPGLEIHARTQNVDIWPTLLELVGLPAIEQTDGRSRMPEILMAARGEPTVGEDVFAFAHLDQTWGQDGKEPVPQVAVTQGSDRLVVKHGAVVTEELFDRRDDHFETRNVLSASPEVANRLREQMRLYMELEPPWSGDVPTIKLDEMELNQLRALGYSLP
jgi:arylsulfatase A-like enzyme